MSFVIGVDFGQKQDYSAIVVAEIPWQKTDPQHAPEEPEFVYLSSLAPEKARAKLAGPAWRQAELTETNAALNIVHVSRWLRGTPYPQIVDDVVRLLGALQFDRRLLIQIIVDATGVGQPVVDMFRERNVRVIACTITGGTKPNFENRPAITVPKRDLVMSAVTLLETGRLRWPANSADVQTMETELRNFQMRYSKAGNEMFEAERQEHDDLVLALSMTTWLTTTGRRRVRHPAR